MGQSFLREVDTSFVAIQANDSHLKPAENAYPNMGKQVWELGMAVHESNRQLAYALEGELEGLVKDGAVEAIYADYGLRYELPELYQVQLGEN